MTGEWRKIDAAAVGGRIKEARLRAGLSQRKLSFEGCSAAYVSRLEAGDRTPSGHLLVELARRLSTTPEWLQDGVPESEQPTMQQTAAVFEAAKVYVLSMRGEEAAKVKVVDVPELLEELRLAVVSVQMVMTKSADLLVTEAREPAEGGPDDPAYHRELRDEN